ncbi:MAG TPA: hypothetical protein VKH42_15740 [Vicinamibacterales bacterium]|nr:hypothetical protein [Vicinamibacterales bacterium]
MARHFVRLAGLLICGVVCSGCFQSTTLLVVKADGSGTIEQRTIVLTAALAQMRQLAALGGRSAATIDPLSEDQARALAASLGQGVSLVSTNAIKTAEGEGRESTYAFTDVSQLRVSEQPQAPPDIAARSPALSPDAPKVSFSLAHPDNGNAVLHINVPVPSLFASPDGSGGINPTVIDQLQALKVVLAGAHLVLAAEPAGAIVATNSLWRDGGRVTLLEIDLDRLLADPAFVARVRAAKTTGEVKAVLKDAPGLKVTLEPDIVIEFTPAR